LCVGCGNPRIESFDKVNDDRYTATMLVCHACAARDRKSFNVSKERDSESPPPAGVFFAVTGPTDD
jgi:protein-arginine kinase activator protein McsA